MTHEEARVSANRLATEYGVPMVILVQEGGSSGQLIHSVCSQYEALKHGYEHLVIEVVGAVRGPTVRLFNTDDGDLAEAVTPDGSQAAMHVRHTMSDLVNWAACRNYSLRDFEALCLSHIQSEIARAILKRRKWVK